MFNLMNLISTPRLRVIMQFAKDPMKEYYQRELSRNCKVSVGATNQILRKFAQLEFVTQEKRGRMYFYKLNLKNPVAKQFKVLLNVDGLYELVKGIANNTRRIILFGSCAQGIDAEESDIDLFILSSEKDSVRKVISEFNRQNERKIAPIIIDANEFVKLKREDKPLYGNIEKGIVLWETE